MSNLKQKILTKDFFHLNDYNMSKLISRMQSKEMENIKNLNKKISKLDLGIIKSLSEN